MSQLGLFEHVKPHIRGRILVQAHVRRAPHLPQRDEVVHYSSGMNRPAEIGGLAGNAVGLAAPEVTDATILAVKRWGHGADVFVDSGAFAEHGGKVVMDDRMWTRVFRAYGRVIEALNQQHMGRVAVVAPDKVGDQDETIARMMKYGPLLAEELKRHSGVPVTVLVPLQRGDLSLDEFWKAALDVLPPGLNYAPSIPSNKDAVPWEEVEAFMQMHPEITRVHLLGAGTKRAAPLIDKIKRPGLEVTVDSNRMLAVVGKTGGLGGGARALTRAREHFIAKGFSPERAREDAVFWALTMPAVLARGPVNGARSREVAAETSDPQQRAVWERAAVQADAAFDAQVRRYTEITGRPAPAIEPDAAAYIAKWSPTRVEPGR